MPLINRFKPIIIVLASLISVMVFVACDATGDGDGPADTVVPTASATEQDTSTTPSATPYPTVRPRGTDSRVLSTPELVELLTPSVVQIAVSSEFGRGVGTGIIFDAEGHILTNWHVVEGATTITVGYDDGTVVEGELFRRDPQLDLAIVRVKEVGHRPAMFGDSDALKVGEDVVAIGHALGLEGGPTVSKGVVSALDRTIIGEVGETLTGLVQTDAAINEGNSGGPLVNMYGEVVGINTVKLNNGDRLGFSININDAKTAARNLIALGPVPPPGFLGVGGVDITRALARALRLPVGQGFGVTIIEPDSPASEAGFELDDIIVQMDSTEIIRGQDLTDFLRDHPSGTSITVRVVRDARFLVTLDAVLVDRPER